MTDLPPPPPPPPGYGTAPTGGGGYSAPSAIGYGWTKFFKNPAQLLVPVLVVAVIIIAAEIVLQIVLRATLLATDDCTRTIFGQTVETQCGPGFFVTLLGSAIGGFVISILAGVLGAGLIKGALNIVDGGTTSLSEVLSYATKSNVITTAALVAAATFVGTLLCYLPGLVVGFLTVFSMYFVVDKDLAPMDAIKASISFTTSHLSETLVFYILGVLVLIAGAVLCLVGLLAAAPIVLLGGAYTFRMLHNEPVTPAA